MTAEEKLRRIFESSPFGMALIGLDRCFIDLNQAALDLGGFSSKDDLIGKHCLTLIPEEYHQTVAANWEAVLREGSKQNVELVLLTKDGRRIHALVSATRLNDITGRPYALLVMLQDITEHKESEEALRRAKEEWERTFDSVPDMVAILDRQHRMLRVNKAMAQKLGLRPEECVGLHCYECVHGLSAPPEFCPHCKTLADGSQHIVEMHEKRLGGDFVVSTTPLFDVQGQMIGSVQVAHDITERKRTEREQKTAADFLGVINESTGSDDLVKAVATFLQTCSGCEAVGIRLEEGDDYPYYEARGFPREFVMAENSLCDRDSFGKVIRDEWNNPVLACMCGNIICGRFDPSLPFFTKDGSFWANSTTELLSSTTDTDRQARTRNRCNGEGYESVALIPIHLGAKRMGLVQLNDRRKGMFTYEDIAMWERLAGYFSVALAKFRAEETLRESEAKLRLFVEHAPAAIAMLDINMNYLSVSRRWFEAYGVKDANLIGRSHYDVFPDIPERWKEIHKRCLAGAIERHDADPWVRTDGSMDWVRWEIRPWYKNDDEIGGLIIFSENISDLKRAEEALQRSHAELDTRVKDRTKELADSQEQLRNLYAHLQSLREAERVSIAREIHDDLGQALTALKMDLSWVAGKLPDDSEGLREKLKTDVDHIDRTIQAVRRVCTELRPAMLDHLGLAAAIEWQASEFQKRTGIKCTAAFDPKNIEIDGNLGIPLFRCFQETLTNVLKHAQATEARVSLKRTSNGIVLTVTDNGVGIGKEDLSKTGCFGLLGIRERVYPWGGKVTVSCARNKGTTVEVTIPLQRETNPDASADCQRPSDHMEGSLPDKLKKT